MNNLFKQYLVITGSYWTFTITDGALRMLVVLYFHGLGYSPLEIAMLFLFYEFFGVVTNLVGGWLGAHIGLNKTMHIGISLQILALGMLTVNDSLLTVPYVMAAQALSGIAKDLNKMSAKSSVKFLIPEQNQQGKLYKWVALLTGSKNSLKGAGFFIGAALLTLLGFQQSMMAMILGLLITLFLSIILLRSDLGKAKSALKREIQEENWARENPDQFRKINEDLPEFLKLRPNLASAIESSTNRYEEAWELMTALSPKQQQKVAQKPKQDAPGSPSGVPKAASMSENVDLMNMSDSEFNTWRQQQRGRR